MGLFLLMWILFTMVLTQKNEKTFITKQISIEAGTKRSILLFKCLIHVKTNEY